MIEAYQQQLIEYYRGDLRSIKDWNRKGYGRIMWLHI
jgi:hypothetical protein